MAATTARKPAGKAQDTPAEPKAQPKPEPAEPYALVSATAVPVTYYKPAIKVTAPDGETIETLDLCPHVKYLHETEAAAQRCGRAIAAQRGLTVGAK